ncbi:MAG TPA: hypothetical protein PK028_06550 [Bacteroidales bacterium]|nr:hypothetical protein [Bacteroidota bacterium]HNQ59100.1 hypothetical protein [Bacteroidales bacterium]HNU20845.1 hypothetical protein [Bacteroidales bacterium]HNV16421.1 hypothetical protein [Bacteroidales bacterium]HNZ78564.1 hypothetical protein [Bacteroidales bacterium]
MNKELIAYKFTGSASGTYKKQASVSVLVDYAARLRRAENFSKL